MLEQEIKDICEKRLVYCHPELIKRTTALCLELYKEEGVLFLPFQGYRSLLEQKALYSQGRKSLEDVNYLRGLAKLAPISYANNKNKVTTVTFGWHNTGVAVDIVEDLDPLMPGIQWSWARINNFLKIKKYAQKHKLEWGGNWKAFKDYPHLQLPMKIGLTEAKEIFLKEGVMTAIWRYLK